MARALLQSTNICAASVYGKSHDSKQRGVSKRMFCNSSVQMRGGLRISASSLSVGGGFNAVDKFQPKVAISIAAPSGRGSRCVARAMLFERRFTDKGNEVIKLAREEAKRMGHNYIVGTEQILLGLIAEGTGIAAKVLTSMGISLEDAQVEMENIIGRGHWSVPVEIGIPRFMEHTQEEARLLGHNYIDSEHLLLGLLREDEYVVVRVLENLGADPNNIRTQVIRMVNGEKIEAFGDGVSGNANSKIPTLKECTGILTKLEYRGIITRMFEEAVAHIDPRLGWIRHIDRPMETSTSVNWPIRVFMRAHEEARRLGHNYMGTEQILLALIGEGTGIAAEVLKSMGINLKDARVEVEKIIGRGNGLVTVEVLITPQAKRVLELSLEEAHKLEHNYIGYEHLLLGILHDGEGVADCVLKNLGADPNNIRRHVIQMISFEECIQMIGESIEAA